MALYEFRCQSCDTKSAILVRGFNTQATPDCPHCGSSDMKRLFSTFRTTRFPRDWELDVSDPDSYKGSGDVEDDPD